MTIRPIFSALLRNKTAPLLVILQVAISLAILCNMMYIVNLRLSAAVRPSGINAERDIFRLFYRPIDAFSSQENKARKELQKQLLAALPGVVSVASTNQTPFGTSDSRTSIATDRKQIQPTTNAGFYETSDSLVKTLGLRLLAGRDFTPDDVVDRDENLSVRTNPKVVIVSQALAKLMYPDVSSVIGQSLLFGTGNDADEAQIIGVVETLITPSAENAADSNYTVISPVRNLNRSSNFVIRTEAGQRDRVMLAAQEVLKKSSNNLAVIKADTLENDRERRYHADKGLAWMLVAVSVLLLLVTASGIVGMSTLWVAQRTKQIGVRRALGARKIDILWYFITENLIISSVGIALGVLLAVVLNQILVSQFELSKLPIAYLFIAPVIFWLLGVLAVIDPARRAANISPATATRTA
ncbi:MAG: FtsX-like permease family protein [Burkholderiaceae bacterium]|nr:FtsX-like permease family protein [Burkholderiaceae bacterium]